MINARPHLERIAGYALADLGESDLISLAQNESAFEASPSAIDEGKAACSSPERYPDTEWSDLRSAIGDVHQLDSSRILCGAGSMELINVIIRTFAGPADDVVGTEYGYGYVRTAASLTDAQYLKAKEIDCTVCVDEILNTVSPSTKIVFVCNPGNPTGTMISHDEVSRLRRTLSEDVLLVIDQAYGEFADDYNDPVHTFELVDQGNTVVTRSLSKAYGLAGIRVGWGYFPMDVTTQMRKVLSPNNISVPAQVMATAAMRDQKHMRSIVHRTIEIRERFADDCRALGLDVPQSHTNFVLIRFPSSEIAAEADRQLRAHKLVLRGMGPYGLAECLRATICRQDIMDQCLEVLKEVMR